MFEDMHIQLLDIFGKDATYTAVGGATTAMKAIIDLDVQVQDEMGAFIRQSFASFASGQVDPRTGDTITVGADSWAIAGLDKDDGQITHVVLGRRS